MSAVKADAGTTNAVVLAILVAAALTGWWWASFSGPFLWLIDLQRQYFGSYRELPAAIALGIATLSAAGVAAAFLRRLPGSVAGAFVTVVLVLASAVALVKAWQLWEEAAHMPGRDDPLQVVDLDRLGDAPLPTGHVRLIGIPDRPRQVLVHSGGRRGIGDRWDGYVPMTSRRGSDPAVPVRIVATSGGSETDAAQGVPDNPDGVLLADGLDTRTRYELRQQGLTLAERPFVLFWPGEDVSFDHYLEAALLALFVVLCWSLQAYQWVTGRPKPA